jgi:hypothetical protein
MEPESSENIVKQCPLIYRSGGHFECESGWHEAILNLSLELEMFTRELRDDERGA